MLDLLLTNAHIVDGTGNPWRKGCVGVCDGRIVAVGSAHDMPEARTVLDIGGNILCPGFIDSHSHSDLRIMDEPLALPKIMQGITTENVGLDSMSVAPISDKNKESWSTSISGLDGVAQKPWGWNGFASYLNTLDAAKPSVNLSSYVGLGTVRLDVMGMEDRPPTAEELRLMEESVARYMEEGACGISAGLIYKPNKYQSTEELVALAKVAARYDGILDKLAKEGMELPHVAITGGFATEDQVYKALALGAPYVSAVGLCRSSMAAAMSAKKIGELIEAGKVPPELARFGTTKEELFSDLPELRGLYGSAVDGFSTGAVGVYSYLNRIAYGLRHFAALNRKFDVKHIERRDVFPLTRDAKELLDGTWLR